MALKASMYSGDWMQHSHPHNVDPCVTGILIPSTLLCTSDSTARGSWQHSIWCCEMRSHLHSCCWHMGHYGCRVTHARLLMRGTIERLVFLLESSSGEAEPLPSSVSGMASKMKQDAADVSVCLYVSVAKGVVEVYGSLCSAFTKLSYYVPAAIAKIMVTFVRSRHPPAVRLRELHVPARQVPVWSERLGKEADPCGKLDGSLASRQFPKVGQLNIALQRID